MAIEYKAEAFKSKFAIILYSLIGAAALSFGATNLGGWSPQGFLADIFILAKLFGIIGLIGFFYVIIEYFNYFGWDRNRTMGLALGLTVAIAFILISRQLTIFNPIEEFSLDARFRLSSFQVKAKDVTKGVMYTETNPDAHPAIQIVGVDLSTVDYYQGWPLPWSVYASYLRALEGSSVNTVMFDIFMVDEIKNNYGLLTLIDSLRYSILQVVYGELDQDLLVPYDLMLQSNAYLSSIIERNGNVVLDYSFETGMSDSGSIESAQKMERIEALEAYELINVIPSEYDDAPEWVQYPDPPIASIGRGSKGLGFANIRKEHTGVNRTLPLIIKWRNRFFPSIDLILAVRYYGIDIQKDVEIKLGEYVKLKNIPAEKILIGIEEEPHDVMVKPNEKREIVIPIDEEGFMVINFIGGPWAFPAFSLVDLAEAPPASFGPDNDAFKNMVLLTAMYYATGAAKDIHTSPFGDMAGIEHHAHALNTILQQDFLHYAPEWVNYLIFIVIGLAMGFIVPRYNMKLVLAGATLFIILFTAEVFFAFNVLNYIHNFFTVYIEMVIVLITVTGYKVLSEEENVKYIRSTFSKFVAKDVVNELLANPDAMKLGGENKELTVFFSDIRGFTSISESLEPDELVQVLNEYLSEMTDIVLGYRGTIDKYMGDAIMAFWGAPLPMKEHAYYAILASIVQLEALKKLQDEWKEQGKPMIDIGIGLNTGNAVAGNMGSSHRMDYTVMGDTINLGSRLEGTNKVYGTRIIISETTYAHTKDKVVVRELDKIRVKGKHEPVTIYELIDVVNREDLKSYRVEEI